MTPPDLLSLDPASPSTSLPPVLRDQLDAPAPRPRGWILTILPAYLGVLVWFPLLDGLAAAGPPASLGGRYLSAAAALFCCHFLLYLPMATLGVRTGRRMTVVAADPLGVQGAEWIAGVLYGLIAALWCSTAIAYSVRLILAGLVAWGLIEPSTTANQTLGGLTIEGPLALACLAFTTWIILAANALGLMGAIAAMMRVYSPFAALVLIATAAWGWSQGGVQDSGPWPVSLPDANVFQYVFAAFTFAGLTAVDWGAVVRGPRDVREGGWIGILAVGAITFLAGLSLAMLGPEGTLESALVSGLNGSVNRWISGALLLLFGLASLAPACFTSAMFTRRVRRHWPSLWTIRGAVLGFLVFFLPAALGWSLQVGRIAGLSGALLAPLAGILTAHLIRSRGRTTTLRPGWHGPGLAAWILGTVIGLVPWIGGLAGDPWSAGLQPAALYGYLAAGAIYLAMARAEEKP